MTNFFAAVDAPSASMMTPAELNEIQKKIRQEEAIERAAEYVDNLPPAKRDPFDPTQVKELFDKFHGEIDTIQNRAIDVVVDSDQSYADAQEMLGTAKKLASAIDKKRKELKEPYLAFTRVLDGEANGLSSRLNQIANGIETGKLLPYARMKEAQRQEAERKARQEAAARQAELDRLARVESDRLAAEARAKAEEDGKSAAQAEAAAQQAAAMAEPAPMVVPDIPRETKVTTDNATSKIEYDWDWSLVDIRLLPDDILQDRLDQIIAAIRPAISARIKAGLRNISGINIYRVEKLKTRTRR